MSVLKQRLKSPRRERAVKNPFPWYTPRFWHGMTLSTWLSTLAKSSWPVSISRLHTAFSITCVSGFNSLAATADKLVYRKQLTETQIESPPIFILGHWRAGTTFLHELLIRDTEHTFPTTYQCFVPHHFVLTEKWLTSWTEFLLPRRRPMDNMAAGWQRPQEDEFALAILGVPTPYLSMLFPKRGAVYPEYLDLHDLSPTQLQEWKAALSTFFRRITLCDPRRIVVKSPPHTARVRTLLELYPDAKFVHISRNPYELFPSTVNLWKSLNEVQRMQATGDQEWVEEYVLHSLERMYDAYLADRELLRENQLYELSYEDLTENPLTRLQDMYERLELGDYARIQPAAEKYLEGVKNYHRNKYELSEEQRATISERWKKYFEIFGYLTK